MKILKTVRCSLCLSPDCQREMRRTQNAKDAVCFPCKLKRNRRRQLRYWDRKGKAKRDGPQRSLKDMKGTKQDRI